MVVVRYGDMSDSVVCKVECESTVVLQAGDAEIELVMYHCRKGKLGY